MIKPRIIKIVVGAGLIIVAVAMIRFLSPTRTIVWTPQNALSLTAAPSISDDLSEDSLKLSLEASLRFLSKQRPDRSFELGPDRISLAQMKDSIESVLLQLNKSGLSEQFYTYLRDNFRFYSSSAPSVMFTGYYEATLHGSTTKHDQYVYPLYARPEDLYPIELRQFFSGDAPEMPRSPRARVTQAKSIVPYYSREEIDYDQKLAGRKLELVWVDSAIEAFFLHIQGSGRVLLDDGKIVWVNYADTNGQQYRSIGRYLKEQNLVDARPITAQVIKAYLRNNPDRQQEIFSSNPSYVFYKLADQGPIGSTGVVLTPNRSIATDNAIFPPGALALIESEKPIFASDGSVERWQKFTRLVLNQDTGGAIRGAGRVDLFTGSGAQSEDIAGVMQQPGKLTFIVKRFER